jgi:hypothetical protein
VPTTIHRALSARLKCVDKPHHSQLSCSGTLGLESLAALSRQCWAEHKQSKPRMAFYDRAIVLFDWEDAAVCLMGDASNKYTVAAMIVDASQLDGALRFCSHLKGTGLIRLAFLPTEMEMAQDWLSVSSGALERLRRNRLGTPHS